MANPKAIAAKMNAYDIDNVPLKVFKEYLKHASGKSFDVDTATNKSRGAGMVLTWVLAA